jgi:cell division protein FtsI (penicillin-binding protein 3)
MSDRPDLVGYFAPPTLSQIWRTLIELLWRIEHAFERSRERNRAVDDTRVRIFGILILFSMLFAGLAVKAGAVALFSRVGGGVESATVSLSRADLVDRNGRTLALDAPLYGVYVDGREIWDAKEAVNAMSTVLPRESAQKVAHAVALRRIELIQSGLTREQRDRIHDLGIVGVTFQDEARRAYPLDRQAAHFVGWSDSQGHGVAGAEKALDAEIRDAAPGGGHIPLSIDLRVQAALESELKRAMVDYQAVNAIGVVTNIQTGEVLYTNQHGELVCRALGSTARVPRARAKDGLKYEARETHRYTAEELEHIAHAIETEELRGATVRSWEEVEVGSMVQPMLKGPLNITDMICWYSGGGHSYHAPLATRGSSGRARHRRGGRSSSSSGPLSNGNGNGRAPE